jgi:hypothetical protein
MGWLMLDKRIEVSAEVLSQEVDGETVVLDLNSEAYFGLDKVGTRVWQLIQEVGELPAVYDIMLNEYDVDAELLQKDLDTLIARLAEAGLISMHEA